MICFINIHLLMSHLRFATQRAFADAHRALVASLEWDIQSGEVDDEGNLPLLKCLLHNEDAFSDIDKLNC